ncbi:MAG: hypothetical protein HQK79_11190 [Desulfobacterales bacterium]|nr:hypothetical protein [Desulfobacterales bacterium]MBF0396902.1 hypothetical protein [Desulfobacterales bacterium]
MDIDVVLKICSNHFVKKDFQERFVQEAQHKRYKLMRRICDQISHIFEERFKGGSLEYNHKDKCFLFELSGRVQETTWGKAMQQVNVVGNGSYLIIDVTGNKFYAQAEGFPRPKAYSGSV